MLIAADNIQIVNPVVSRAVREYDPKPIRSMTRQCVAAGADAIDINPGPLKRDPGKKMRFLVDAVQSVTDKTILIDTVNPEAIEAGLEASRNHVIINGISLQPEKIESILPLAIGFGADVVGYLLYPDSTVPANAENCSETAIELFGVCMSAGLEPSRLIIDPVIAPVMWENGTGHNLAVLSVIKTLPELLGEPVRTIAGLSNLTSGPGPIEKKRMAEQAFLSFLASSGLSIALMNVFHEQTMKTARACKALLNPGIFTWEELA